MCNKIIFQSIYNWSLSTILNSFLSCHNALWDYFALNAYMPHRKTDNILAENDLYLLFPLGLLTFLATLKYNS